MKWMRALLCAAVLGAFSVPAVAAPAKAKKSPPAKVDKAKQATKAKQARRAKRGKAKVADKRIKKYDFLGDELEGDIVSPDGDRVRARVGATFTSLIEVRLSFLPEITKEGENL